jgi:cell division protein FtsI (penicillin-binding protein 3)
VAKNSSNSRIYYLGAFLAVWCLAICLRLVWVQVICYGDYAGKASRQQQRSIDVSAVRGNIYDRNGNELAMTVQVDSVFAVPSEIPDIHSISQIMARILGTDASELERRMNGARQFVWVARRIESAEAARIRALNLKGIYFQKEAKRFYPKREMAAQVLGAVGTGDEGLTGLEMEFQPKLAGKPGTLLISMDAKKHWLGRVEKKPEPGENVVLTIDEKIQYIAERELERSMADSHSIAGTIIVENPRTGEILALANRPTFNPNLLKQAEKSALVNRAVSDIYEPGSTFKVVTLAAALEEKITTPDEVVDCQNGSIIVNGLKIHDHKPYGDLTVAQVLANSSDVGAIKIALRLGDQRMDRYIRSFGFGSQTGIELPYETRGMTQLVTRWSKVSIGAISMGQEIGVSPVQLASMISTIANDGVYVPPRIVAGITPPRSTQQLIAYHPALGRRVISPMTAAQMKHMLEGVVLRGTGTRAILDGYSSAGKTGTSQKVDDKRYSHQKHVASFAGFAPINNPAITVLVVMDTPQGPQDGGLVAAPVFSRVAQQVLGYMNVPHDVELQDQRRLQLRARANKEDITEGAPDYIADSNAAAVPGALGTSAPSDSSEAASQNAEPVPETPQLQTKPTPVIGRATSAARPSATPQATPMTLARAVVPRGTLVVGVGGSVTVPDFRGKPLRTALEEAESAGLELEISGSGVGKDQSPAPGVKVMPGGHVVVRFGRTGGI